MSTTKPFTAQENTADQVDPGEFLKGKKFLLGRFDTTAGPVEHIAEERDRLTRLKWENFSAQLLGCTVGAEISDIQIKADMSDEVIAEIRSALLEYKVLFFRNQLISSEEHIGFAQRFGELEVHPFLPSNKERPELVRFQKDQATGGYENGWHSDVTWRECPSMGAVLHAVDVPEIGGDTLFADMYAVYEGLDEELKAKIDPLMAVNDYMQAFGQMVPKEKQAEMRETYPAVLHPVVRTHPETGRKLLYVNRFFTSHIEGMDQKESEELLKMLCRVPEIPEYQCRFRWEKDSMAFWDNRAVQHYAASDYWPNKRVMERASIIGDRPI